MNLSEDNLIELLQSVARIEQKLDGLNHLVTGNGKKGLQERVEGLEGRWMWVSGAMAVLLVAWEFIQRKLWK